MSKFVGAAIGAVAVGVGLALGPSGAWLVKAGATMVLSSVANALLAPKLKAKQGSNTTVQLGEVARQGLMGQGATAGSLVDAFNFGGKYGTDWTVLVLALADHRCQELTGFYVKDKYVAFGGDGLVPGYSGQLRVSWRPGAWDDDVPDWVLANCPVVDGVATWTADDRGRGVAKVYVAYKADKSDAKNPVWSGGQPDFLWVVKGLLCYQARKDSSVGGSGAHRWDDPATREWSANPIDCRYTWARGIYAGDRVDDPSMLLLGRGLSDVEAPPHHVFAPANVCDEAVPLAGGGTEPRYRVGGVFGGEDAYIDTEEDFMAACGGWLVERDGAIEMVPGAAQPVVWDISDDDLVIGTSVKANDFRTKTDQEWVNSVAAKYVEPEQKWKDHSAPVRRSTADIIADKEPRVSQPSLALVTSGTQAQRIAEQIRRLGRLPRTRELTLPPRLIGVQHGDWLRWTSRRYGQKPLSDPPAPLLFRVESDSQDEKWQNRVALRQMAATVYAWSAADELADGAVAVANPEPDFTTAPAAADWSLSATITGSVASLRFSGGVTADAVSSVYFDYAQGDIAPDADDDAAWMSAGTGSPATFEWEVPGISTDQSYWGAVSYQAGASRSERRVLGPVSASAGAPIATALGVDTSASPPLLAWRMPDRPGWSTAVVYRGVGADETASVAVSDPRAGALFEAMQYEDDPLPAGTYWWWVRIFDADGNLLSISDPVSGTVV